MKASCQVAHTTAKGLMNLKELAESLDLSQTTVSRALNGYPEVSESTRQRVLRAAVDSNYLPNVRAAGLATGKAMAIGHIIPVFNSNDVVNPVFGEFIAGASQTYSKNGYELLLTVASTDNEEELYRNIASKSAVDGVIVHSPRKSDDRVALLREIGLPFVIHGRVNDCEEPYSWIDVNNRQSFRQACQLLLDMGHSKVALINGPEFLNFAWLRCEGYKDALRGAGIAPEQEHMSSSELTESYGFTAASRMLASENPPSAFLVSSYVVAIGVSRAIGSAGLVMGREVSVITHDDELSFFDNHGGTPQFTATRSSVREAGKRAASMLLNIIESPQLDPVSHLMESKLTVGASTGPPSAGPHPIGPHPIGQPSAEPRLAGPPMSEPHPTGSSCKDSGAEKPPSTNLYSNRRKLTPS